MANIKSAKKRIKVNGRRAAENRVIKNSLKAVIKSFYKALESGDLSTAEEKLIASEKALKKASAKGLLHKNTASRKVSRMTISYNKAKAQA